MRSLEKKKQTKFTGPSLNKSQKNLKAPWFISSKKNETKNKSFVTDSEKGGAKEAKLTYQLIASSERYHLLEITLETGRHHQIRAQLAAIGCFIKGDIKYGAKRSNEDGSICLHARRLTINHPVTKEVLTFIADTPNSAIWKIFEK